MKEIVLLLVASCAALVAEYYLCCFFHDSKMRRDKLEYERDHHLFVENLKARDPNYVDTYETRFHVKWDERKRRYVKIKSSNA